VINLTASVAAQDFLAIQPGAGVEWVIHNVHHEAGAELHFYDGTNTIVVMTDAAGGSWTGLALHATNTKYYRIKNTDAAAKHLGYDGVQTK